MGCFDVSCGISSITIKNGDDALLLLLLPSSNYPETSTNRVVELKPDVMQVFNDGPKGMYMPFCLPIRGKYNDYGSLEEIVQDDAVKALESYFGATVEQIISVIRNGEYGTIHSEEIIAIYGNDLEVSRYGDKAVTPKWLAEAGFTEKDGKYYHPEVTNIIKFDSTSTIVKTEEPKVYVEFKVPFRGSNEKKIMPHIVYWENEKWNEIWQRERYDFCNTFMEKSKPMGWFADDYGIALGIKKDKLKKAKLMMRLSGMFIDGKVYDGLTSDGVKTNMYYSQNAGNILDGYMNKFLMDLIGFKFERIVDDKTKEEPKDMLCEIEYIYSHEQAPGLLFGVADRRSMATDMYRIVDGKLDQINGYRKTKGGYAAKTNYSPFSPTGLAKMFKSETGNELDLSGLDNIKPFHITLMRIQDYVKKQDENKAAREEINKRLEETPQEERANLRDELRLMFRLEDRSDSRERANEFLGDLNFPFVWDFYNELFRNPSDSFKKSCETYKNLMTGLWGINRPLMPSAHFGQHGDYINQLAFSKIVSDVVKSKILDRYAQEFSELNDLIEHVTLLYGSDYYVQPKDGTSKKKGKKMVNETTYMYAGEEVAVWDDESNYGYLITKGGR